MLLSTGTAHKLARSGFQHRGSSKSARDMQGKTKLTNGRTRARGAVGEANLSEDRALAGTIVAL